MTAEETLDEALEALADDLAAYDDLESMLVDLEEAKLDEADDESGCRVADVAVDE